MNILGAIFPLGNFIEQNNSKQSLSNHLQSTFTFAQTCLLCGDADECFRSLLFQSALSYASIGKRIYYYTPLPIQTIPSLVHRLIPKSLLTASLDLIKFHYLPTLNDVHNHLSDSNCDVIIIDGYLEFPLFKQQDLFRIISACALLKDTYEYLKNKLENKDLVLLCSCTCSELSMANVKKRGLFDLSMHIEMLENGDYHANIYSFLNKPISCTFNFRITCNEIMPLFATIQHHNN